MDSSVIFGVNNIGIVALSVLVGTLGLQREAETLQLGGNCFVGPGPVTIYPGIDERSLQNHTRPIRRALSRRREANSWPLPIQCNQRREIKATASLVCRKHYHDARHHCYAWRLGPDKTITGSMMMGNLPEVQESPYMDRSNPGISPMCWWW